MKKSAYLVGPFIGELEWEMYRFTPYLIYLKKENPYRKLIVYTRSSRFDLYGKFADILVPLNFKYEKQYKQLNFGIKGFDLKDYNTLKNYYYKKYLKQFDILDHIVPDIAIWRSKIKWQFPKSKMTYDFQPRRKNEDIVDFLIDPTKNVFVTTDDSDIRSCLNIRGYNPLMNHWLVDVFSNSNSGVKSSFIGCLIVYLKECDFVVGNIKSSVCKLALLLGIPVVSIDEKMKYDAIHLLNPLNTPVINCTNIEEGVDIYEDNF